ncbi:MAG: ComEC/Rec2 family competence protein [Candidatus Peregrinibacteria bacterium]
MALWPGGQPLLPILCIIFLFNILALVFCFKKAVKPYFCIIFLFIAFVCLGLGRAGLSEHKIGPDQVDFYNGQKLELVGTVTEVDIRRDKAKYKIRIKDHELRTGQGASQVSGDVLISMDRYPHYEYGDLLRIYGELQEPGEFDGFSYDNYLSRYGIYSVMYRPKVELLERGKGSLFWRGMTCMQGVFIDRINKLFPEPHGSFEAGLLVGERKGIPPDLMEKFNITGLTHIIAISGYNITIIIAFVMFLLKGLPRRIGFGVAVAAIILFTLFVGASPAVTRAGIMGILGLIALNSGRQNHIHITVFTSAFLMVLWNPKILWWDVGFQLSFMAVMGLIYVAPLFEKYGKKLPEAFGVREAVLMTLSAQVMALPVIIFNFERLSLIAPLANLLVVFAIPLAMLFGFVAVALSFLFYPLALLFAYITWGILSYIIKIVEIASAVPYASVTIPGMRLWMLFGYYAALAFFLYLWRVCRSSKPFKGI